ncbi:MAG: efflux RND transporter periplasmic adaptor subunit [Burkholderiales bacterium]|nr:efflux RND transporter periplasmic adaptor subunit [Burkholderiales bacterium]
MNAKRFFTIGRAAALLAALALPWPYASTAQDKAASKAEPAGDAKGAGTKGQSKPALTVTLVQPASRDLPLRLVANGSVAAWQEAVLGAEANGLRLLEVRAQVGDAVRRGQVLAVFASETVAADLAQARAALAEAEAAHADAKANAERAQSIAGSGALSTQQVAQYATAEKTGLARVESARAVLAAQQLRMTHTQVKASDDGVISARSATVGAVVPQGQELFRLIRKARLEWRGEVTAAELPRLKPGVGVSVVATGVPAVAGRVRVIAPTVDPLTRNALVYVDLPEAARQGYRPGMFARGEFTLGASGALTLPQDAVVMRDGFAWVYRAGAADAGLTRVARIKVELGRRVDDRIEVLSGLKPEDRVVAAGAAFLADGDLVKVAR